MRYLLDTNIILRFAFSKPSGSELVRLAVEKLQEDRHQLLVAIQNQAEFWNVATRPRRNNGFGLDSRQANYHLGLIEKAFPLISESHDSYRLWRKLILDYGVSGVQVHDARLVSVMLEHRVERILTLNDQDFRRYEPEGIKAIHPRSISSAV